MSPITTTVVFEKGVLRPTEKVELRERHAYKAILVPLSTKERPPELSEEEVLARQRLALQKLIGVATTETSDDASVKHDEYLYG